jgi:CBS domain-containing protein
VGTSGEWALIGMAAMMGGTMRAPFTAVVFGLELTHAFGLLPPMLAACVAAELVTVLLLKRSILTQKIARRGHHLTREYSVDPLELIRVAEVMDRRVPAVSTDTTVAALSDRIAAGDAAVTGHHAVAVVDRDERLRGIVTRGDLLRALEAGEGARSVLDAGSARPVVAYPGETVKEAAERMVGRGLGRLLVVAEEDPAHLIGYLGREQVLSARLRWIREEQLREHGLPWRKVPAGGGAGSAGTGPSR